MPMQQSSLATCFGYGDERVDESKMAPKFRPKKITKAPLIPCPPFQTPVVTRQASLSSEKHSVRVTPGDAVIVISDDDEEPLHAAASQHRKPAPEKSIILPDAEAFQLGACDIDDGSPISTRTRQRRKPAPEKSIILPVTGTDQFDGYESENDSPIFTRARRSRKTSIPHQNITEIVSDDEARPTRRLRRNSFVDSGRDEEVLERASSQDQSSSNAASNSVPSAVGEPDDSRVCYTSRDEEILEAILAGKLLDDDDEGQDSDLEDFELQDSELQDSELPEDCDADCDADGNADGDVKIFENTTAGPAVVSANVERHIVPIVAGLLNDAKMQTKEAVLRRQTAWHFTAWGFTSHITVENTLSTLLTTLTPGAVRALGEEHITIEVLANHLPKYNKYYHGNSMIIYAMIGKHVDGRHEVYIGSSSSSGSRIRNHRNGLSRVRRNMGGKTTQYVHEQFGMPGWRIEFRLICIAEATFSKVWKLWFETIWIILMKTLEMTERNAYHNDHTANLVCSLEQVASTTPIPVNPSLRLNRCLPTYQGFEQRLSKDQRALRDKCYWCGFVTTTKTTRYRVEGDDTMSLYQCWRCYRFPSRQGLGPEAADARQKDDARRQWKMKDYCESCGVRGVKLNHHPDPNIHMTICAAERDHWKRTGELAPNRDLHKNKKYCESCGLTCEETKLVRHPDRTIDMTLCRREYDLVKYKGVSIQTKKWGEQGMID